MESLADRALGGAVQDGRTSGAVAVFVRDGQVRFAKGYGVEDASGAVPVNPDRTLLQIASITKTFTALQVARLHEKGTVVSFDDPVNSYLHGFKVPDWGRQQITLRNLFTHTAGLDEVFFGFEHPTPPEGAYADETMITSMPALFRRPGDFPAYSNFGIDVLGAVVAGLEGRSYIAGVQRDILKPLGMESSRFVVDGKPPAHMLHGFIPQTKERLADTYGRIEAAPSGGLFSTGADMGRYMIALLGGDSGGAITPGMRAQVFAMQHDNAGHTAGHGMVFELDRIGTKQLVLHGGSLGPNRCWMAFAFEHDSGLFYCHSTWDPADHHAAAAPISALGTARTLLGALLAPDEPQALAPPAGGSTRYSPAWDSYLGDYLSLRRLHVGIGRMISLLQDHPTLVTRGADGMMVDGQGPAREIAHGVFVAGIDVFAFTPDPAGSGMILTTGTQPSAFEKVGPLSDPRVMRPVLALLVATALSGLLYPVWPAAGRRPAAVTGAVLLAVAAAGPALVLTATAALDLPYVWGVAWPLRLAQAIALLLVPAVACLLAASVAGVTTRPPSLAGRLARLHCRLLFAAALTCLAAAVQTGLFSLRFT